MSDSQGPGKSPKPDEGPGPLALLGIVTGELVGTTGVGVGFGYWATTRWGWPWWVLLLSSVLALTAAFYRIYRVSQRWTQ